MIANRSTASTFVSTTFVSCRTTEYIARLKSYVYGAGVNRAEGVVDPPSLVPGDDWPHERVHLRHVYDGPHQPAAEDGRAEEEVLKPALMDAGDGGSGGGRRDPRRESTLSFGRWDGEEARGERREGGSSVAEGGRTVGAAP